MKKILASYLYFLAGILFAITSILHFGSSNKPSWVTYLGLAITFISLGFVYRNKNK